MAIAAACSALFIACGGKIAAEGDVAADSATPAFDAAIDSTADSSIDSALDVAPDTSRDTALDVAIDTAPEVAIDTAPPCPSTLPKDGTSCAGGGGCRYTTPCASEADCIGGVWRATVCAPPGCPHDEPLVGSTCIAPGEACAWNSACGGVDRGACAAGRWAVSIGACPPPTDKCPATLPAGASPCATSGATCVYGEGCGAVASARCVGGAWLVDEFPCKTDCPAAAPVPNSACPKPPTSSRTCGYTFGPTCSFSCFCAESRWSCYGTPCTEPPDGGPIDGGH